MLIEVNAAERSCSQPLQQLKAQLDFEAFVSHFQSSATFPQQQQQQWREQHWPRQSDRVGAAHGSSTAVEGGKAWTNRGGKAWTNRGGKAWTNREGKIQYALPTEFFTQQSTDV